MNHKRNVSIEAELNELIDWQRKARTIGYVTVAAFLGINLLAWIVQLIPEREALSFLLLSALFCIVSYLLYRLNFHVERLVIHTLVIRKELLELEEVVARPKPLRSKD